MTPKKIHVLTRDLEILDMDTPLTRAWVSLNPHEDRTEYTDLSLVWHDAKEEPEAHRQVIAVDKKGSSFCGKYWSYDNKGYTPRYQGLYWSGGGCLSGAILAYWEDVVKWAYIEDLLSKGGEK